MNWVSVYIFLATVSALSLMVIGTSWIVTGANNTGKTIVWCFFTALVIFGSLAAGLS